MSRHCATGLRRQRSLSTQPYETLESRLALSATPPTVTEVSVASDDWTPAFTQYLEDNNLGISNKLVNDHEVLPTGYSIPVGSADQDDPLPWDNIDQIRIRFSEDVQVDAADLSLTGVNQTQYAFSNFDYYPEIQLAVWTLDAPLDTDRYWIDLDADGLDPVTDRDGHVLDGEWTNGVSTVSGDGTAGGDFEFSFGVLPGDALGIGLLEYNNLLTIYYRQGLGVNDANYLARADIDGDGLIEASDWQIVWNNLTETTPTGTPVGATNDAPTTAGFDLVEINDNTIDVALSLYDAFEDAETTDQQLSYAIESVSDPSLFDYVFIDSQTGELIINTTSIGSSQSATYDGSLSGFSLASASQPPAGGVAAASSGSPGVSGRGEIVVSATDQSGQRVESTVVVDVNRQNVVPTISVTASHEGFDVWVIEGWVTDSDNDLDDFYVQLTGSLSQLVSVAETGYFYYAVLLDPGEGGPVWADTFDGEDESNTVFFEIGF